MTLKDAAKYIPLNFGIMLNPVNWVIVALVVALAGVGLAAILVPTNNAADETV